VTDPLSIRGAVETDLPAIRAIEVASFGDPWSEDSFRSMIAHPRVRATVAERAGRLVGYCIAWVIADESELANLAVAPEARRAGVGARLLDDLLAALDAKGGVTVHLEVRESNDAAQALYRSRGFTASGRRRGYYARPHEDAVVMRREPGGGERAG
jgi:ribosomal-protein-alanine acetyltransferase